MSLPDPSVAQFLILGLKHETSVWHLNLEAKFAVCFSVDFAYGAHVAKSNVVGDDLVLYRASF